MAQKKRQRRRKHRGTQGGRIDRRGRTSRPMSRKQARSRYREERVRRQLAPPTWSGAAKRALLAAGVFFAVLLLLGQPIANAVFIAVFMYFLYIPLGYAIDLGIFRWRQGREASG